MKKVCFILFLHCPLVFSQEFNVQWLNNMSNYLGRMVRDIPDSYTQEYHNKSVYSRELSNEVYEGFNISSTNIINGIVWVKKSKSRSFLYSELDKLVNIIKNNFGKPLLEEEGNFLWNWQSKPLIVSIQEGEVGVTVLAPDAIGLTQDQWNNFVNVMN